MAGEDRVVPGMVPTVPDDHPVVTAWAEIDARVSEERCDGVPVFWAEMALPRRAQLMFRVGRADEPFVRGGISHLVEHLTLSTLGDRLYAYNGSVDGDTTAFSVAGTDEDIVEFLSLVCAALRRLPVDRFEAERRVLLTEAARRTPDPVTTLLAARYGCTGFGMLAMDEFALRAAQPEEVQAWAEERFVAANAALMLTGPPPPGLHLDLPGGARFGDAVSVAPPQPLPTALHRKSGVVAFSTVLSRRSGIPALSRHLQRALTQRLRSDLGITYAVQVHGLRVDAENDHLTVSADALPEQATAVTTAMLAELDRLAERGVEPAELERDLEQSLRVAQIPDAVGGALHARAYAALTGEPYQVFAERARRAATLTPERIAERAALAREHAMWVVPTGTQLPEGRFTPYAEWSPAPVRADRYFKPLNPSTADDAWLGLAIGEQGISVVVKHARFITVRWEDCVGMQWWTTGQRVVFARDAFRVAIDPATFEGGDEIRRLIDAHVPEALRIPMGELATTAPAVAPKRRTGGWRRVLPFGIVLVPLSMAVIGYANLPANNSTPAPTAPSVPLFSFDPTTHQITVPDTVPLPAPQHSGGESGAELLAVVGAGGTIGTFFAAARYVFRRRS